jgi:hypothetical protein
MSSVGAASLVRHGDEARAQMLEVVANVGGRNPRGL